MTGLKLKLGFRSGWSAFTFRVYLTFGETACIDELRMVPHSLSTTFQRFAVERRTYLLLLRRRLLLLRLIRLLLGLLPWLDDGPRRLPGLKSGIKWRSTR